MNKHGVSTDPDKVAVVSKLFKVGLMEADDMTPPEKCIRSCLGMFNYYQHLIPIYSAMTKPLFFLLAGKKVGKTGRKLTGNVRVNRYLLPSDSTDEHGQALFKLKDTLANSVVLAHSDFSKPYLLSINASLDGLGAVLSQVPGDDTVARPVALPDLRAVIRLTDWNFYGRYVTSLVTG